MLDGHFAVKEEGGQRFLELPGAPLETFGVMFGPASKEDWQARARFLGTGSGTTVSSVFGASLNGVAGYRIQVSPGKKAVELLKGDDVQASAPFQWENGSWTVVRVRIRKTGGCGRKVEGKA